MIVSLSGESSSISTNLHPEIELDERFEYSCCLLDFSIQNTTLTHEFDQHNYAIHYYRPDKEYRRVTINEGPRGVPQLMKEIEQQMVADNSRVHIDFHAHMMKFKIRTSSVAIDFTHKNSIGRILGYDPQILERNTTTDSDYSIGQINADTIRVNCDLVSGSFHDGISTHTLHEFHPKQVINYKMFEQPEHLIYLPVIKQRINSVNITVTDQGGKFFDLKGGKIHCRLHITRDSTLDPRSKC